MNKYNFDVTFIYVHIFITVLLYAQIDFQISTPNSFHLQPFLLLLVPLKVATFSNPNDNRKDQSDN